MANRTAGLPEAGAYRAAVEAKRGAMRAACRAYDAFGGGSPEERAAVIRLEAARLQLREADGAYRTAAALARSRSFGASVGAAPYERAEPYDGQEAA